VKEYVFLQGLEGSDLSQPNFARSEAFESTCLASL